LDVIYKEYNLDKKTRKMLSNLGPPRVYEAGDIIYYQDEPSTGLVYLEEGRLKNVVFYPDGTLKTLCILEAPSITGETAVIDNGTNICSAMAVTKVKVVFIPREKAQKMLLANPNLMMLILEYMAKKIRSMLLQAQEVVSNIPQRLAYMLLHPQKYGVFSHKQDESRLLITHDELASFIGTTRPKITEHLNDFMKQGLIQKGRGFIQIVDPEGLKMIANH
jgi:CRP/FNR family cyclic AMP-dependent transcriptional regulator